MKQRSNKVVKYKKPSRFHFVGIVFGAIFLYLIVQLVGYLTKKNIQVFQVETPIAYALDSSYEGIITRTETNYYMGTPGYINYYIQEGKKVRVGSTVLTIDSTGEYSKLLAGIYASGVEMNEASLASIKSSLETASQNFDGMNMEKVSEQKYYINASVMEMLNVSAKEQLEQQGTISGYAKVEAPTSGFIMYQTDNYGDLTPESVTMECLDEKNWKKEISHPEELQETGMFAYKCIADDAFAITFPISEKDAKLYGEKDHLKVYLDDVGTSVNGEFSIITSPDNVQMGVIRLSKYGSSYLDQRYIKFHIVEKNISGLKIPVSSIVEKQFFVIPKEYLAEGGERLVNGVNKTDGTNTTFVGTAIIVETDTQYCIDSDEIQAGDVIVNPATAEQYTISEMESVTGVYNVNQGYCIFQRTDILTMTDDGEYYIVNNGGVNGITAYDRIVFDASQAAENTILYE
ncbi:MAG: HlyD family efflux transporter periplasmic adaptor subunit [Candidatus Fimimorpha sp.]